MSEHAASTAPSGRREAPAGSLRSWAQEATRGDAVLVTNFVPDGVTASNAEAFGSGQRRVTAVDERKVVVTRRRSAQAPRVEAAWMPPGLDASAFRVQLPA